MAAEKTNLWSELLQEASRKTKMPDSHVVLVGDNRDAITELVTGLRATLGMESDHQESDDYALSFSYFDAVDADDKDRDSAYLLMSVSKLASEAPQPFAIAESAAKVSVWSLSDNVKTMQHQGESPLL